MNLKKQIKIYLEDRNIRASELCRLSGFSKQSISEWMAGSNPRDIRHLKKVAQIFNVSVDHLVFGGGFENEHSSPISLLQIEDLAGNLFGTRGIGNTVTNSYYNTTNGMSSVGLGVTTETTSLSTAQIGVSGNFTNWDFTNIWQMASNAYLGLR
jgi:transcriptional regulator with XRE-family HTH domain